MGSLIEINLFFARGFINITNSQVIQFAGNYLPRFDVAVQKGTQKTNELNFIFMRQNEKGEDREHQTNEITYENSWSTVNNRNEQPFEK